MSFIDLHCHMAWDIDDGIDSRAEAQQALQQARVDGIVKLAATPHFIPGAQKEADVREMDQRIRELRELGKEYGVTIYSGCEMFLNDDYLDMVDGKYYNTINESRYLLCEFDVRKDIEKNSYADEQLYELSIRGLTPMIAHAERYFHKDIDVNRVKEWINNGYVIQMNRTSLLGMHGSQIQKNARRRLEEGLVHIVASDAHRTGGNRICRLSDVYQEIVKVTDTASAELLCTINPQHVLQDEDVERMAVRKRSWLQRMRRR